VLANYKEDIDMDFLEFPKMARLSRECVITEKIDGTNAQIFIDEDGNIQAGSRTRWVTPSDDNYGFAAWVVAHMDELLKLGPGRHFGEWWGAGIQRKYGQTEKRFSLFNTSRWCLAGSEPKTFTTSDPRIVKSQEVLPECCGLVPEIYRGVFNTDAVTLALESLSEYGSQAAPGFMKPEGIVVYHIAAGIGFKKTLERDEEPKGKFNR
jgi:hypothetical protein